MGNFVDTGVSQTSPTSIWTHGVDPAQEIRDTVADNPIFKDDGCGYDDSGGCYFKTIEILPGNSCSGDILVTLPFPCISVTRAGTPGAIGTSAWLSFNRVGKSLLYTDANADGSENWLQVSGYFLKFCKPFSQCFVTIVGNPSLVTICFSRYLESIGLHT
jgi:hypothetical protein